jgi:outer membrane protein TolC
VARCGIPGLWGVLGAFLLATGVLVVPLSAGAAEMSLPEYLRLVLKENKEARASLARVESARASVALTAAEQRMSVGLKGETARVLREEEGQYALSLALSQRIDLWGKNTLQERGARLALEARKATHAQLVNSLLAEAESAYWTAFMARKNLDLYESLVRQREEDLRIAEERHRVGAAPRLDVVRASVQLEKVRSEATRAEAGYRDALASLARLAGGTVVEPPEAKLEKPELTFSLDLSRAEEQHPDLQVARITEELAKVERDLAKLGMKPTLDGSLHYTILTDSSKATVPQEDGMLSLVLGVTLYDGGTTKADTARKEHLVTASGFDREDRRDFLANELALATHRWEKARALERAKAKEMELAVEELRITRLRYETGAGTQLDLLDSQVNEQSAATEYLDAVKEMYLALVDLRSAMGEYAVRYATGAGSIAP